MTLKQILIDYNIDQTSHLKDTDKEGLHKYITNFYESNLLSLIKKCQSMNLDFNYLSKLNLENSTILWINK